MGSLVTKNVIGVPPGMPCWAIATVGASPDSARAVVTTKTVFMRKVMASPRHRYPTLGPSRTASPASPPHRFLRFDVAGLGQKTRTISVQGLQSRRPVVLVAA